MTSPDDRDPYAPPPEHGESPPPQAAWGPPPRPGDPPFGAPQPPGGPGGVRQPFGAARQAPGPVDRGGLTALMLGVGGLFLVIFPPVGIVFGVFAVRAGIRARRRAAAGGGVAPGAGFGIGTGIAAILASSLVLVVAIILFRELRDYQDCMAGANTNVAENDCRDRLSDAIERRFGID